MPRNSLLYLYPPYPALLIVLVAVYLLVGGLYAVLTPPWQSPDEPAHYNYIAQVAGEGCCPVIERGDWDAAELDALKAAQFPDDADISAIEYEDHQPPLYYFMATPIFAATNGSLVALRLFSVLIGVGVMLAAFYAGARLFPRYPVIALAMALLVGFIPQHMAILASVNNDGLAELLIGTLMVIALGYMGNPVVPDYDGKPLPFDDSRRPHASTMGGFLGLILVTKLTGYAPALVIVVLAIAWRWRIEGRSARWLVLQLFWIVFPALLIAGPWWARNAAVYGFPDVLGQAAHNSVVAGQLRTAERLADVGTGPYLLDALTTTYHSFWGQFGWMGVPMQPRVYAAIGVFMVWALIGALLVGRYRHELPLPLGIVPQQRAGFWTLMWSGLATLAEVVYYNMTFVQFQGRYLYPALIPFALLLAVGAWGWALLLRRRLAPVSAPGRLWARIGEWFPALAMLWIPFFALYALFRYVVPFLD